MAQARKYKITCDSIRTSGVTTVSETSTYDLTEAFSGTSIYDSGSTFSYAAITLNELKELSDVAYETRVTDFMSYVSQFMYEYTLDELDELIDEAQWDSVLCPIVPTTTTTTTTSTTTTTAAPTTTTTTTASPTTTTTTTAGPSSFASLNNYACDGSDFSQKSEKCSRIEYSPALGATQSWGACMCWQIYGNTVDSSDARACAVVWSGTSNICSCDIDLLGGTETETCDGTWFIPGITSASNICANVYTCAVKGDPSGCACATASVYMYDSVNNIDGTVTIGSPSSVAANAEEN